MDPSSTKNRRERKREKRKEKRLTAKKKEHVRRVSTREVKEQCERSGILAGGGTVSLQEMVL